MGDTQQAIEQWASNLVAEKGWLDTIAEIIKIYEYSSIAMREDSLKAFTTSWETLYASKTDPTGGVSTFGLFKINMQKLRDFYNIPDFQETDYKSFDTFAELALHVTIQLQEHATCSLPAVGIAEMCRNLNDSPLLGMYALTGVVISHMWEFAQYRVSVLLNLMHGIMFTHNVQFTLKEENMKRAINESAPYYERGKMFFHGVI